MSNTQAKQDLENAAVFLNRASQEATWEKAQESIRRAAVALAEAARSLDP
jgi:hypothetical protein